MIVRHALRAWSNGKLVFEKEFAVREEELDQILRKLMERLAAMLAPDHMIEVEFLDEPDSLRRFFRFGSDPGGMVMPIKIEEP